MRVRRDSETISRTKMSEKKSGKIRELKENLPPFYKLAADVTDWMKKHDAACTPDAIPLLLGYCSQFCEQAGTIKKIMPPKRVRKQPTGLTRAVRPTNKFSEFIGKHVTHVNITNLKGLMREHEGGKYYHVEEKNHYDVHGKVQKVVKESFILLTPEIRNVFDIPIDLYPETVDKLSVNKFSRFAKNVQSGGEWHQDIIDFLSEFTGSDIPIKETETNVRKWFLEYIKINNLSKKALEFQSLCSEKGISPEEYKENFSACFDNSNVKLHYVFCDDALKKLFGVNYFEKRNLNNMLLTKRVTKEIL